MRGIELDGYGSAGDFFVLDLEENQAVARVERAQEAMDFEQFQPSTERDWSRSEAGR